MDLPVRPASLKASEKTERVTLPRAVFQPRRTFVYTFLTPLLYIALKVTCRHGARSGMQSERDGWRSPASAFILCTSQDSRYAHQDLAVVVRRVSERSASQR